MAEPSALEVANHVAGGGAGAVVVYLVHALIQKYRPPKKSPALDALGALRDDISELKLVTQDGIADLKAEQRVQAAALAQQRVDLAAVKERSDKALDAHREMLSRHQDKLVRLETILELRKDV